MSTNISPVVDLHSRLNVTAVLGSGAMRGPGLTQQWGLPAHYFCTFNTSERWNAIGAKNLSPVRHVGDSQNCRREILDSRFARSG